MNLWPDLSWHPEIVFVGIPATTLKITWELGHLCGVLCQACEAKGPGTGTMWDVRESLSISPLAYF